MSILVDSATRVLVQGITGQAGAFHTDAMLAYGTPVVAGVTPGKAGSAVHGVPVFKAVKDAVAQTRANATVIFVPAKFCHAAVMEAVDAALPLIVVVTEGMPTLDMVRVKRAIAGRPIRLIGPNCPGLITPGIAKLGIMPGYIHTPGRIGVLSRSGTLTYDAVYQLTQAGLGQSTCIGIGGDPVIGSGFTDLLGLFHADAGTDAVVLIGEIGGTEEEEAAAFITARMTKPVFAFVAGRMAPKEKRMGHAGAIVAGGRGTAQEKLKALAAAGVTVIDSPAAIGHTVAKQLRGVVASEGPLRRNQMKDRVAKVIDRIRPAVQMDGGDIELVSVDDGIVKLRLVGACHGCPSSMMTLKAGIERAIQAEVPEVKGVEAVE